MPAKQLKETTMSPESRTLIRVSVENAKAALVDIKQNEELDDLVERLMGKNAESRFDFIQKNAIFADNIDV